jgi:SNF2 family DNA or RNA helicase
VILDLDGTRMRLTPKTTLHLDWAPGESFPICGDIVRRLREELPQLELGGALRRHLAEIAAQQKRARWIAEQEDVPGDPRLLPHQRVAVDWLRCVRRGILADAQGLGKTVMSLSAVPADARRVLIVCSNAKRIDWAEHGEGWTHLPARIHDGGSPGKWDGILVIGYAGAVTHWRDLRKADVVIVDEAHQARNRKTQLFIALTRIVRDAGHVFLLTATPTVNVGHDVWTLLHLADPQRWGSYWSFVFRFFRVTKGYFGMSVSREPAPDQQEALDRVLSAYALRREGVLDLPELRWETVPYRLPDQQRLLYEELRETGSVEGVSAYEEVAVITRLRQLAIDPGLFLPSYEGPSKLDLLERVLAKHRGQAICFTMFSQLADRAAARIPGVVAFHGGTSAADREKILKDFRWGTVETLVLTYGVGGEGLNLTEANRVILLDPPWHPAGVGHAVHRIHRYGQTSGDLAVISLHATGTIEDDIRELIAEKRQVSVDELLRRVYGREQPG